MKNTPEAIFWWLVVPVCGAFVIYLVAANWREWRRNRRSSK